MATTAKVDLAQLVAKEAECPRSRALQVVDAVFEAMRERLLAGDRTEIRGFGTLCGKQARGTRTAGIKSETWIPSEIDLVGVGMAVRWRSTILHAFWGGRTRIAS